jgi:magnesium transporter
MGFLQICAGVVLLQMSKSAKDVPDAAVFKGDLDQVREIGEQEQPESEPKADAIRGTAALLRRFSGSRQRMEEAEARRYREEKLKDQLEPVAENEIVEWDGLRRRKTVVGDGLSSPIVRRKTIHPPLGMSHFPDEDEQQQGQAIEGAHQHGFFETVRTRATSVLRHHPPRQTVSDPVDADGQPNTHHPVALHDIKIHPGKVDTPIQPYGPGSLEEAQEHIYGLPQGLRRPEAYGTSGQNSPRSKPLPAQPTVQSPAGAPNIPFPSPLGKSNRRQFSFQNMFRGPKSPAPGDHQSASNLNPPPSRSGIGSRSGSAEQKRAMKTATEEERLGLVKGDSHAALLDSDLHSYSEHDSDPYSSPPRPLSHELQYPYAAPAQDSVSSSPEAHTPLVPKHSYLLSSSTMSDNAPLYKELHTPGYSGSGRASGNSSASRPPPLEKEAGVDDEWQIPTGREPHRPQPLPPPTIRFSSPPKTKTTSPPPPAREPSQLPTYHSNNPYQPHQKQPQRLPESTQPRAVAAADSDPSQNTSTSPHQNKTGDTTARDTQQQQQQQQQQHNRSDSSTRNTPAPTRQETAHQNLEQALAGTQVTSPQELEYEERWRRFGQQKKGRSRSRGADGLGRGGAAGGGGAAGAGAFM